MVWVVPPVHASSHLCVQMPGEFASMQVQACYFGIGTHIYRFMRSAVWCFEFANGEAAVLGCAG